MLLAVAISPTFTWYLRAMAPRVSPGLTVCFTESAGPFAAGAASAIVPLVGAGAADLAAVVAGALPGMMSFWPWRSVDSGRRLFAAASSAFVRWFLWAMDQRLSPLPTV